MFELDCKGCGAVLRLKDEYLGRRVKCPKCGTSVVAEPEPASSPYDDDPLFSINTGLQPPPVHQEFRPLTEHTPVPSYLSSPTSPRPAVSNPNYPASTPPVPVYSTHDAYPNGLGHRATTDANPNGTGAGSVPSYAATGAYNAYGTPASMPQASAKTWSMSPGKIATGLLMMLGAVGWFVAGLAADRIFFYPPILFIIGIGTVIKGCIGQTE